jgi:protein MpaA
VKRVVLLVAVLLLLLPSSSPAGRWRIGKSVEGRPIVAMRLGDPSSHHKMLVVGCIHGNECAGRAIVRRLRRTALPRDLDLWLVPDMNPDGSRAGTRQNARGVDLNRNFSYRWRRQGKRWDTYYSGPRPFSEPESRAARDFIRDHRPDITIWYHQHMSLVVKMPRHRAVQRRYARLVNLPLKDIGRLPGTATRWQNHKFPGHIAFVVELPAGSLSKRSVKRHTRAVLAVSRML